MDDQMLTRPHWSFWLISILLLIWNVMGCVNFFMQMSPEVLALYRATERILVESRPLWATVGFAVAVFGGALGSLLLLRRKGVSYQVFLVSLFGVCVTQIHALTSGIAFSRGEIAGIIISPLLVAVFLARYAWMARSRGWLSSR